MGDNPIAAPLQLEKLERDEWLTAQIAATEAELKAGDGCHTGEAESLRNYLGGKTAPQEAAAAFITPVLVEDDPPSSLYRPMGLLCTALVELGDDRDKLLDLMAAIQSQPPSREIDWADLPGFGNMWADLYNLWTHGPDPWEKTDFPLTEARERELRREREAIATVEAELYVRGLGGITAVWGYETLSFISSPRPGLEIFISALHVWLTIAGAKLKEDLDPGEVLSFGQARTMGEHWGAWTREFLSVSERRLLSTKARTLAAECYQMMR